MDEIPPKPAVAFPYNAKRRIEARGDVTRTRRRPVHTLLGEIAILQDLEVP